MKYTLKVYVDSLFKEASPSQALTELHDEILSNLEARYDDCIAGGMSPQRAYAAVIGTMGDVSALIDEVSGTGRHTQGLFEKASPAKGKFFKKYSYIFTEKNIKTIKGSLISVMWILITVTYFLISVETDDWEFTWLIFLIGAIFTIGINLVVSIARISRNEDSPDNRVKLLKTVHGSVTAIMWLIIVILFFIFGFGVYNGWEFSWLIFLLGAAAQIIVNMIFKIQIRRYKGD